MEFERKYGKAVTIPFPLVDYKNTDLEATPVVFEIPDTKIIKDGGAPANSTNKPVHVSGGLYKLTLTAAEREAEVTAILIKDVTATKEWEDQTLLVHSEDPYNGHIHIDTVNGTAGTAYPNGSHLQPVSNITDAKAIADENNIEAYHAHGSIILNANHKDWSFYAGSVDAQVDIGGFDVKNSQFFDLTITGTQLNAIVAKDCTIEDLTDMEGRYKDCTTKGTNLPKAGAVVLWDNCSSGEAGLGTSILDMVAGGAIQMSVRRFSGSLNVKNCADALIDLSIETIPGRPILDNTCTLGTIVLRGLGTIADSSNGTTVNKDGFIDGLVENGHTLTEAMRLMLATMTGKCSGGGTGTVTYRDANDNKDRLVYTVDSTGNRTNVIKDAT